MSTWELEQELFLFFVSICDHLAALHYQSFDVLADFHHLLYA